MNKTDKLGLWLPGSGDPVEVGKLSENFEALDTAIAKSFDLSKAKSVAFKASGTFVVPDNAKNNEFTVVCQGGGGGGGCGGDTSPSRNFYGGGGGAGGYTEIQTLTLNPGDRIPVVVGSGGAGGSPTGESGGASKFGELITANGGEGGFAPDTYSAGSGGSGGGPSSGGGGGGGGGGLNIGDGSTALDGQTHQYSSIGGKGGEGYGAGGGGGFPYGGSGLHGIVIISWVEE